MQMLDSLDRLAALPGSTRVCCGHEYTVANAAFALTVDPSNALLQDRSTRSAAHAPGRPADGADHARRRTRLQSVPAHRHARGSRRGVAGTSAARCWIAWTHSPNCGAGKTGSAHEVAPAPGVRPCRKPRARGAGRIGGFAGRPEQQPPRTPPGAEQAPVEDLLAPRNARSGRDIYTSFREGLADPSCPSGGSVRWKQHFANAPRRMASANDDVLPLFGYVVDAVREAHLPTEYALIPFVESGYKAGARSPSGPAGLWQFIQTTARNHDVPMRAGYDGRLSPVDSTRAAVRYLKTLHGMFAGDWRLAVMAYNAGEYRVLGVAAPRGQNARNAKPETLPGLSPITHAYVQKLRALSCLLEQADDREEWMRSLDRPVAHLRRAGAADRRQDARCVRACARARRGTVAPLQSRVRRRPHRSAQGCRAARARAGAHGRWRARCAGCARDSRSEGVEGRRPSSGEVLATASPRRSHTVARGESPVGHRPSLRRADPRTHRAATSSTRARRYARAWCCGSMRKTHPASAAAGP